MILLTQFRPKIHDSFVEPSAKKKELRNFQHMSKSKVGGIFCGHTFSKKKGFDKLFRGSYDILLDYLPIEFK